MIASYILGTIGVAVCLYGLLANQSEFSLSGLGAVVFAVLSNTPIQG